MSAASLTSTLEDYLEAILNIVTKRKVARSMEIAENLNVTRPTVTVALRTLAEKGLIDYEPRSYVTLTEDGEKIARCVDQRHHILRDVFTEVFRLPVEDSEKAACLMEHGMDTSVCRAMTGLLNAVRKDQALGAALHSALDREYRAINCEKTCDHESHGTGDTMTDRPVFDLNTLRSGQTGKIVRIIGAGALKKRLGEMGITAGQPITVVKSAPLDDPIEIKVRNYNLSLRREEAANILIESV